MEVSYISVLESGAGVGDQISSFDSIIIAPWHLSHRSNGHIDGAQSCPDKDQSNGCIPLRIRAYKVPKYEYSLKPLKFYSTLCSSHQNARFLSLAGHAEEMP